MADHVTCRRCEGHGKVLLVPSLQATLDLVRGGATSAATLARAERTTHNAMCNRLVAVSGKEWAWYAVPQRAKRSA